MLTKKFWDTAKVVLAEDYHIHIHDYEDANADCEYTATHCGTVELSGIHENTQQSCRKENVVSVMLREVKYGDGLGHFVYYCPVSREYNRATKLLKSLGFKKISSFTHFGYLDRSPDYGRSQMWSACLTHNERKRLKELDGSVD
jgi:hypothetical protein